MGICFSSDGWADLEPIENGSGAAGGAPESAPAAAPAAAAAGAAVAAAGAALFGGGATTVLAPPAAPMKPMSTTDYYSGVNCYYLMVGAGELHDGS